MMFLSQDMRVLQKTFEWLTTSESQLNAKKNGGYLNDAERQAAAKMAAFRLHAKSHTAKQRCTASRYAAPTI